MRNRLARVIADCTDRLRRKTSPDPVVRGGCFEQPVTSTSYFSLPGLCSLTRSWIYRRCIRNVFPESVWAKGSSNSGGLSNIFTSSHLQVTSSNLHIFSSSHPDIFTSSHLHIFTSAHLHTFSSSHLLTFTSSHLHIFTSSHPHIFSSSHPHIFTSSHLHIFTSSHLLIFSSSHLLIFTSSHLLIFTSSHLHILSCPLAPLPSCSLALLLSCPFARNEVRSPIAKNCCKIAIVTVRRNPFARNGVRSPKTGEKLLSVKASVCKSVCV